MSKKYKIVVLRGDGVSQEVIPETVKTLKSAKEVADRIEKAVDLTLKEGKVLLRDLGGSSKTNEVGDEIAKKIHIP